MLYVGLVAGVLAGNAAAHAVGLNAFRVFFATHILIVIALIGARLLYVAKNWMGYKRNLARICNRSEGGLTMYGGLLLALPLSVPLLAGLHIGFGAFWDVATFTILVGMVFTRIGCMLNGCCAGRHSDDWLGVYLPNQTGVWDRRVPTQCLEAGWAAVLLVFASAIRHFTLFPGSLFLCVAAAYCCGRLWLESTREAQTARPFTSGHLLSVIIITISAVLLIIEWPS